MLLPTTIPGEEPSITELSDRVRAIEESIRTSTDKLAEGYHVPRRTLNLTAGDLVYRHRVYPASFKKAGIDTKFWLPWRPELYLVLEKRSPQYVRVRPAADPSAAVEDVSIRQLKRYTPRADALSVRGLRAGGPDGGRDDP